MDAMKSDKEIDSFKERLEDRFGHIPEELENLFFVLKIRNLGMKLGFEKIIFKNGMLICFFVSGQMNTYYKSDTFGKVLQNITQNERIFTLKQTDSKLKTVSRGMDSLSKAHQCLEKLI